MQTIQFTLPITREQPSIIFSIIHIKACMVSNILAITEIRLCVSMSVCVSVCVRAHMRMHVCMCVCMCMCLCTCVCVFMWCMHMHVYEQKLTLTSLSISSMLFGKNWYTSFSTYRDTEKYKTWQKSTQNVIQQPSLFI